MKIIFISVEVDFVKFVVPKALTSSVPQESMKLIKGLSKADIFHVGSHTRKAKNSCPRPSTIVESAVAVVPTTPPSSIQSVAILKAIREKRPWQEVKNITDSVCNTRKISNEKIRQKKMLQSKGTSFEGVKNLKHGLMRLIIPNIQN